MSAISDKYNQLGGVTGFLGNALSSTEDPAPNGGLQKDYSGGTIYWHQNTGAFEVHGSIRVCFQTLGGVSAFGYPISDETTTTDKEGRFNNFEGASVYWHPSTGAFEVHGRIRDLWRNMGAERSILGYPMTNETGTPDNIGRYNHFQNGSVYWTPTTGAHEVYGAVRSRWAELRWERGILGYPTASPFSEVRNRITYLVAIFQQGKIELNQSTQQIYVEKYPTTSSPNYSIPLVAFHVSDDDGGRPCATNADGVRQWVDTANQIFAAAGVHFDFNGTMVELRDTEINSMPAGGVEGMPNWPSIRDRLNNLAIQNRSVAVVFRFGPGARSVGGGFSWSTYNFVAMSFFDPNPNALTILAHELGHHFGLPHTHSRDFATVREAEDYILSGGTIESLDGDSSLIHDTLPDPLIRELDPITSITGCTLGGKAFSFSRSNIMSYWNHGGMEHVTHDQIDRIRQVVLERRALYLNVSVISPVNCSTLLNQIATLQNRLAELRADRDADPLHRSRYAAGITSLMNQINTLTNKAHVAGCI